MASGRPIVAPPAASLRANQHGGGSIFTQQPLRPAGQPVTALLGLDDSPNPFLAFWRAFVNPAPPIGLQPPGGRWRTLHRRPTPPDTWAHLRGRVWFGSSGRWYPVFIIIDVDAPRGGYDEAMKALERLGFREGVNCVAFTSPSWDKDRSFHVLAPVAYKGKHATLRKIQDILKQYVRPFELYPQAERICRWPLGRDQVRIRNGIPDTDSDWVEALKELLDLEPVELAPLELPRQRPLVVRPSEPLRLTLEGWTRLQEAQAVFLGYVGNHDRFEVQGILIRYFYRMNFPLERTIKEVQTWMRKKGYLLRDRSRTIDRALRTGDWSKVDKHIARQAVDAYKKYWIKVMEARASWSGPYPDGVALWEGFIAADDIVWVAELFRGDLRSQRRMLDLIAFVRPRLVAGHDWIYIPKRRWKEIAEAHDGNPDYEWRNDLEARGILEAKHDYRHWEGHPEASYSKKFRIPALKPKVDPMLDDNRPIRDIVQAAVIVFGSRREAAEALGLPHTTAYRLFDMGFSLDRLCVGCGAVLENVHGNREFCSHACQMRYWRKHRTG